LSNRGRRALVREVTKNPMVTLTVLQSSSVEIGCASGRLSHVKHYVWKKPGTIPTVKYGGGSIMLWGFFNGRDWETSL
jgi:hypothetical protein